MIRICFSFIPHHSCIVRKVNVGFLETKAPYEIVNSNSYRNMNHGLDIVNQPLLRIELDRSEKIGKPFFSSSNLGVLYAWPLFIKYDEASTLREAQSAII